MEFPEDEREKRQFSRFGDGFALLPLGESARCGTLARWPDASLSVFTVLIAFENKETRKSFPSFDTIAALGGVSKGSVGNTIYSLQKGNLLTPIKEPISRGRTRYVYEMRYTPYSAFFGAGAGSNWVSIYDDLIKSGTWAVMPPSARKLYLVMKAFTVEGFFAETGWLNQEYDGAYWGRYDFESDFDFMPASTLDGFGRTEPTLAELCGVADRTYRDARAWLIDNQLMHFYEGGYYSGLAFPYRPNRYAPKVLDTMESKKKAEGTAIKRDCTGHTKKIIRSIRVRSTQAKKRGGDTRLEAKK